MRRLVLLLFAACAWSQASDLLSTTTVYFLPMRNGMDQYLANQLTRSKVYTVVNDPAQADAVFTDSIGEPFEKKLAMLYPTPKPPAAAPAAPAAPTAANPPAAPGEPHAATDASHAAPFGNLPPAEPVEHAATYRRAKGGVYFLVDRRTKQVLWSFYDSPRDSSPYQMDYAARQVASKLSKDVNGLKRALLAENKAAAKASQ